MILTSTLIAATVAVAVPERLPRGVWAQVSRSAAISGESMTIDFIRDLRDERDHAFTLRLTQRHRGDVVSVKWANSRTCPAVRQAIARLNSVPYPTPNLPSEDLEVVADGGSYSVRFTGRYGRQAVGPVELTSNVGTPLAAWVDETAKLLEPCWSPMRLVL